MTEKERPDRGLENQTVGQPGNRARKATMVFGGSDARRIRTEIAGSEERHEAELEQSAKDPIEYDRAGEDKSMKGSFGRDDEESKNIQSDTEVGQEDVFRSYDDIFDLPIEPQRSVVEAAAPISDPFEVPLEEDLEAYEPPESPKPAPIAVGKIVRPSAQMLPSTAARVELEVAPMHEVQIPVAEAPKVHTHVQGVSMTSNHEQIFWKNDGPLVGFLVSFDYDPRGSYVELRTGRLIISSQREESGNCLVVLDPSVSPMHAIMRVASGGVLQVLDQLSESGTRIIHNGSTEETFLSGEKTNVGHGDVVFFGERKFHVCLIVADADQ